MNTITSKSKVYTNPTDKLLLSDDEELFLDDSIVTRVYGEDGIFPPAPTEEEEARIKELCRQWQELDKHCHNCKAMIERALELCAGASQ